MPTVELDIRQLADEGGTAPIAPITVTDAVLDENGDTLTDILDELKNGSMNVSTYAFTLPSGWSVNYQVCKKVGKLVFLSGLFVTSTAQTTKSISFANVIPEEIYCPARLSFAAFDNATDTSLHGIIQGRTITFYRPETTSLTQMEFSVVYSLI